MQASYPIFEKNQGDDIVTDPLLVEVGYMGVENHFQRSIGKPRTQTRPTIDDRFTGPIIRESKLTARLSPIKKYSSDFSVTVFVPPVSFWSKYICSGKIMPFSCSALKIFTFPPATSTVSPGKPITRLIKSFKVIRKLDFIANDFIEKNKNKKLNGQYFLRVLYEIEDNLYSTGGTEIHLTY
jgi:hypothetical protein